MAGLYFDKEGKGISRERYCELFADDTYRVVALTVCADGVQVSTIWLGLNHGIGSRPEIFETMTRAPTGLQWGACKRYSTQEDALAGHALSVERHGGAWQATEGKGT